MLVFSKRIPISILLLVLSVSSVSAAPSFDGPIFQMQDGSYYQPSSGKSASTREALLRLLSPTSAQTPNKPASSLIASAESKTHDAILRSQALLKERLETHASKNLTISADALSKAWFPVTLAIWNKETDSIELREILRQGKNIKDAKGNELTDILVIRSNGVNSEYVVEDASGSRIVVANIHPILKQKDKNTYGLEPVIYVPYSEGIHTASMVLSGREYINGVIDEVYASLRQANIRSRKFTDKSLVEVIDKHVVQAIAIIEHLDPGEMQKAHIKTTEEFFVTLASNEGNSYAYSRSSAGALGLVQFIPQTYQWLVQKRPELHLIKDFETGMRDPANAIKAQIGYLDILLNEMPEITSTVFDKERARVNEYLVAAYNGGSGKTRRAMSDWNKTIEGGQQDTVRSLSKQHATIDAQIAALQKKIRATKAGSALTSLRKELATVQVRHNKIVQDEAWYQKFALKDETRLYVKKYRLAQLALHAMPSVQMATPQNR